jgi:hypothetical protein
MAIALFPTTCVQSDSDSAAARYLRHEASMDEVEPVSHSFVIKIWLEETAGDVGQAIWRGHITHVGSGVGRYVKDLQEIIAFIVPYLRSMGVRISRSRRLRWWFT